MRTSLLLILVLCAPICAQSRKISYSEMKKLGILPSQVAKSQKAHKAKLAKMGLGKNDLSLVPTKFLQQILDVTAKNYRKNNKKNPYPDNVRVLIMLKEGLLLKYDREYRMPKGLYRYYQKTVSKHVRNR